MNKNTFTLLFTLISTIINIVLTVAVIAVLATVFLFTCKLTGIKDGNVIYMGLFVCLIAGMIINFYFFSKLTVWAVKKFNLAAKLNSTFVARQLPGGKNFASQIQEPQKKKTKMPDSVLETDEDSEWKGSSTYQNFGIEELQRGLEKNNAEAQALIKEREVQAAEWEESRKKGE